jgi:hypothetical protein
MKVSFGMLVVISHGYSDRSSLPVHLGVACNDLKVVTYESDAVFTHLRRKRSPPYALDVECLQVVFRYENSIT